jgi:dihydrofolate synthase / folylpolyglutamate synthase
VVDVEELTGGEQCRELAPDARTASRASEQGGARVACAWTQTQAEQHLRSLELFGMRFGLDRMRRMMTALSSPQRSFEAIHVLGTNGKSSTTRMIAAILERHGVHTGAYLSPHLISYTERVQVGERDLEAHAFASAVARAARAAEQVNRTLSDDDHVTQFELLTAAAIWELARRGIDLAVVEAGLGGRYDATSVIDSRVTVLTNVGLEHTRWLGPTLKDIAEEKLAAVQPGSTLVLGADLAEPALAVAQEVARERPARIVTAGSGPGAARLLPRGSFQRRNFALARAAAESYLSSAGMHLSEAALSEAAESVEVAGRLQILDGDPLTVLDGAHNPDAILALLEALPEVLPSGAPVALVLGVLEDKDAAAMLAPLLQVCERAWFTAPPSARALSPAALQSLARQLGFEAVACEPKPSRALAEARRWASEHGGAVLATGSVYLVGDLLGRGESSATIERPQARSRRSTR